MLFLHTSFLMYIILISAGDSGFFSCAGSWPTTPFSPGWPKAPAALGDQGKGTLWLCVEGSADERLCSSENLPHSGERDTALGSYLLGASPPVLRCSKCL